MAYRAIHRHARISATKVRPLADLVRGKRVDEAVDLLKYQPQRGARMLEKVILSAIANAEDRGVPNRAGLRVTEVKIDGGPMFKRIRPRARGMAHVIKKRCRPHHRGRRVVGPTPFRHATKAFGPPTRSFKPTPDGSKSQSNRRLPHRRHGGLEKPLVRLEAGVRRAAARGPEDSRLRPEEVQVRPAFRKIHIERTRDEVKVVLHTARPGIIIGRKGTKIEQLQDELQALVGRRINIKIEEIGRPEIARPARGRRHRRAASPSGPAFRRTHEAGAGIRRWRPGPKGIKIQMAGRLGGAEMARREKQIAGSMPLSTLRAKIDYGFTEAMTPQGHIGIQVWVNQGMYQEDETDGADAQEGQAPKKPKRAYKR